MPTLRLIGLPALLLADAPILPLERKDAALLAVLALDGPTARDALAALLWPEVPLKTANTSLRQRVFRLRKRSGHDLVDTGERVALQADINLEAALKQADAVDLPSGDLLGSFSYSDCGPLADWVQRQREHWRARRRDARTLAAARHEAQGELARAIEITQQLVAEEPLSEHAQRRLMRLHYLRGDRAAAVQAFEAFERVLKDELNTRPDRETVELLHTIEHAQPAAITRRAVVPASLRRPPRLVGREAELNALDHAWAAGRVFVLLGEAGLGKTRLLQEFATSQGRAVWVQARPGDGAVPFALLARLLRAVHEAAGDAAMPDDVGTRRELARVMPELGTGVVIAGEGQRLVLQRAIESLLHQASERGVSALLVDDLHFADAASLEMLQGLIASERLGVLHWGLAQRPGEGGSACEALMRALEETQRLQRVTLQPLNVAQIQALIESLNLAEIDAARWAAPLLRHTGGNPLFALETLKDMVLAGVPDDADRGLPQPVTVGALIERRLRQLTPPALALARVAAIAGVDFSIDLAEHVLKTPALALADAWSELEAAQVLQGAAFAHDLVYDAALRTVPAEIARHTHAAVAEYLDSVGAEPAARAVHYEAADRLTDAGHRYREAARRAMAVGRRADEVRFLRRAAANYSECGEMTLAFEVRLAAVVGTVTVDGADAALGAAEQLLAEAQGPAQQAAALAKRAFALQWLVRAQDAADTCLRILALGPEVALSTQLYAVAILASSFASLGRAAEGADLINQRSEQAAGCDDDDAKLFFFGTQCGVLTYANMRREAERAGDRHLALARRCGRRDELLVALANVSAVKVYLGALEEAIALAQEAQVLGRQLEQDRAAAAINDGNLGWYLCASGRYSAGLPLINSALEEINALMPQSAFVANLECFEADALLALGQPARVLRRLLDDDRLPPFLRAKRLLGKARASRLLGRPTDSILQEGLRLAVGDAAAPASMSLRLELALLSSPPVALDLCGGVERDGNAQGALMHALLAKVRRIRPLLSLDRTSEALDAARSVLHDFTRIRGPLLYHPEVLLEASRAFLACDRPSEALEIAREALRWVEERASADVPPAFRESFVQRNPVNRELRELVTRGPSPSR